MREGHGRAEIWLKAALPDFLQNCEWSKMAGVIAAGLL